MIREPEMREITVRYHRAGPDSKPFRKENVTIVEGKHFYTLQYMFTETGILNDLWISIWVGKDHLFYLSFTDVPVVSGDHAAMDLDRSVVRMLLDHGRG
jgi:hypothetical protein